MVTSSDDTSPAPAIAKTFDIYELFESTLLHLPLEGLLLSQAVCTQWRDLHANSSPIQQALFKKPINKNMVHKCLEFTSGKAKYQFYWSDANGPLQNKPTINPFLDRLLDPGNPRLVLHSNCFRDESQPLLRSHASWRKMLISQSARDRVFFYCHELRRCKTSVLSSQSVTMNDLMGFVAAHAPTSEGYCGADYLSMGCILEYGNEADTKLLDWSGWEMLQHLRR